MAKYVSSTQRSVTLEDVSNVRILPRLQEARGSWYDFDASAHADSSVVTCASMRAGQTTPSDHGFTGPFSCRCCCRHGIDHADLCGRLSESCREANAPCAVEQEIFRWCCSLGVARALADLIGKWEPPKSLSHGSMSGQPGTIPYLQSSCQHYCAIKVHAGAVKHGYPV